MAAIFDFPQIRTSVILLSTLVVLPDLENMGIDVGISLLLYEHNRRYKSFVRPVHGRHFDFRHGFLSSVIFVIGGNSAALKNIIPITVSLTIGFFTLVDMMMPFFIQELYKIVYTNICCSSRHGVTTGNFSMGEPLTCAD